MHEFVRAMTGPALLLWHPSHRPSTKYTRRGSRLTVDQGLILTTIPPPPNQRFCLQGTFHDCSTRERPPLKKIVSICFVICKGLSNDDVEVARGTVFQEVRPGAIFETGHFVKEKLGGLP